MGFGLSTTVASFIEAGELSGRTGFVEEEEDEFGFGHTWFVVSEGHPDIQLEDYKVGLSSRPNNWKQFM